MTYHIVLVEPQIPQNTGTIARLTAAVNAKLHLVKPLGFEITDKYLKRAGLDYWPEVKLEIYENWQDFLEKTKFNANQLWYLSTHATKTIFEQKFTNEAVFVFGNEGSGLAKFFHEEYKDQRLKIPMYNQKIRSLNIANAASIMIYEAIRQNDFS